MKKPKKQWPPVSGIQKIPDGKGPATLNTAQAVDLGIKFAKAIHKAMQDLRAEEKGSDRRVRDPLQTRVKSYRGWRAKAELDLVQAGIAGA